jgi:hypothetical protein
MKVTVSTRESGYVLRFVWVTTFTTGPTELTLSFSSLPRRHTDTERGGGGGASLGICRGRFEDQHLREEGTLGRLRRLRLGGEATG